MENQTCVYDREIDVAARTTMKVRKSLEYQGIARRNVKSQNLERFDISTIELSEDDLKAISENNQDKTYFVNYTIFIKTSDEDINYSKVCNGATELQKFIILLYQHESEYGNIKSVKIKELFELPSKFILKDNEEINTWLEQKNNK